MAGRDDELLIELDAEVVAELAVAHVEDPEALLSVPPEEWLFDPTDLEREEVGLRNLLGAVEALEQDLRPGGE
jgi:hypothetical protein